MSNAANSYYFRRRVMGRAASPPTWACYEQIHDDYSNSDSDSCCSEDDEDYNEGGRGHSDQDSDSEDNKEPSTTSPNAKTNNDNDIDMDMDDDSPQRNTHEPTQEKKDIKGKQKAIEPEPESPRRQRKKRQHVYTLRPILTIQRSQGFVWNQDLFVPPYIKDRYVASTSPPNSRGFISTSLSSTHSGMSDYEVEVVEIRVNEGDLDGIIP